MNVAFIFPPTPGRLSKYPHSLPNIDSPSVVYRTGDGSQPRFDWVVVRMRQSSISNGAGRLLGASCACHFRISAELAVVKKTPTCEGVSRREPDVFRLRCPEFMAQSGCLLSVSRWREGILVAHGP